MILDHQQGRSAAFSATIFVSAKLFWLKKFRPKFFHLIFFSKIFAAAKIFKKFRKNSDRGDVFSGKQNRNGHICNFIQLHYITCSTKLLLDWPLVRPTAGLTNRLLDKLPKIRKETHACSTVAPFHFFNCVSISVNLSFILFLCFVWFSCNFFELCILLFVYGCQSSMSDLQPQCQRQC